MYIEVNLLPQAFRPKRKLIKLDYKFMLIMLIIFGAAGVGYYYHTIKGEQTELIDQIDFVKREELHLKNAVILNAEVATLRTLVAKRISIIKELTSDSDVRFVMLEHINSVLPENLWLMNIAEVSDGNIVSFNIEGMSYSKENISSLLAGLKKFEKFSNVELESIRPAPLEIKDAYNFVVKVTLIPSRPVVKEEPVDARGRRSRRR